jgi:propionate catabolism operon transcriptional regulator
VQHRTHGESGTGKELIAREIYQNSTFNKGNFVALNCSAIPSELFESELFGHRDGAFTGSRKGGRKGLVEEANDGVLFLDEISELAMDQQAKLLRFLQERTYRPLGANEETPVNLKLVAASNKPLKGLVEKGEFREDLYYRLNVFNLFVPPLRLRKPDITTIARYKLTGFLDNYSVDLTADDVLRVLNGHLVGYDWPGNIRELENVLERLVATLAVDTNLSKLNQKLESIAPELFTEPLSSIDDGLVRSKELELVVDAMNKFNGNKTKAAEYLGMSQTTLWRRLKRINE